MLITLTIISYNYAKIKKNEWNCEILGSNSQTGFTLSRRNSEPMQTAGLSVSFLSDRIQRRRDNELTGRQRNRAFSFPPADGQQKHDDTSRPSSENDLPPPPSQGPPGAFGEPPRSQKGQRRRVDGLNRLCCRTLPESGSMSLSLLIVY